MPAEVQKLCEVMAGIDPNWSLEDWLKSQASSSLDLISSELEVELKTAEQRIQRIIDIKNRITDADTDNQQSNQLNLFDCFSIEYDKSIIGLGSRAVSNEEDFTETHPVSAFLDLLPNDQGDDPLLAVACQNLLMIIDGELAKGKDSANLDVIVAELDKSGISFEEIDEAIEHCLMTGVIIEIDDDCFITI
tara:strand:+ start:7258 stop:7830 length:573 start_codon:yes stop_codon:yes gene_type:complete